MVGMIEGRRLSESKGFCIPCKWRLSNPLPKNETFSATRCAYKYLPFSSTLTMPADLMELMRTKNFEPRR